MRVNRLLHDSLLAGAAATPDKTALVVDGQRLTYAELLDSARRFAAALQRQGLERGDRVVVFTDNSLPCVVSIFGTLIAGGVFVVVNPQTKEDKLAYILERLRSLVRGHGGVDREGSRTGRGARDRRSRA